jgi:hypothetical protein
MAQRETLDLKKTNFEKVGCFNLRFGLFEFQKRAVLQKSLFSSTLIERNPQTVELQGTFEIVFLYSVIFVYH